MILSGEKTEEYRDITRYYTTRFVSLFAPSYRKFPNYMEQFKIDCRWGGFLRWEEPIRFRNGYRSDSPSFIAYCTLSIDEGKPEWGAEPGKKYYVLTIHSILKEN